LLCFELINLLKWNATWNVIACLIPDGQLKNVNQEMTSIAENFREQAAMLVELLDISIPMVAKLKVNYIWLLSVWHWAFTTVLVSSVGMLNLLTQIDYRLCVVVSHLIKEIVSYCIVPKLCYLYG